MLCLFKLYIFDQNEQRLSAKNVGNWTFLSFYVTGNKLTY